ncbi:MAG: hypothetical protein ACOCTI_00325 [Phycisphaeraceae bacterium]
MPKPRMTIGLALLAAVAIFVVTLVIGESPESGNQDEPAVERPDPLERTVRVDPGQAISAEDGGARTQPLESTGEGRYSWLGEDRETTLTWERGEPRPQGVVDVTRPRAEIAFFEPEDEEVDRIVTIDAGEGSLVAPENQPQAGDLRENVVVRVHQPGSGEQAAASPEQKQLELRLDHASFDLELGHLESSGPVRIDGPKIDLRGRELSLTFNQLRQRIERMEIFEGESLGLDPAVLRSPEAGLPAEEAATVLEGIALTGDTMRLLFSPESPEDASAGPGQNYLARFERNVRVATRDDLAADPAPPSEQPDKAVRVTWDGPLVVEPFAGEPARGRIRRAASQLMGPTWDAPAARVIEALSAMEPTVKPGETRLRLTGRPATMTGADGQEIMAGTIEYDTQAGTLFARDSERLPLVVEAPKLGVLQAKALLFDQPGRAGLVRGPGQLDTGDDRELRIVWQEALKLDFEPGGSPGAGEGLGDLRRATFTGGVGARHPRFGLEGETLTALLSSPADDAEAGIERLLIGGDARLTARENGDEEREATFAAEQITLDLVQRSGETEPRPTRLIASGGVRTQSSEGTLGANALEVYFGEPAPGEAESLPVTSMLAVDDVEGERSAGGGAFAAERMELSGSGRVDLWGGSGSTAMVRRKDAELTGDHLVILEDERRVEVDGPGRAKLRMESDDAASWTEVTWASQMWLSDSAGRAEFRGEVRIGPPEAAAPELDDEGASRTLTARELDLDFVPEAEREAEDAGDEPGLRLVRRLEARGGVEVAYQSHGRTDDGKLLQMMRLRGPKLVFQGREEMLEIAGAGSMGLVDRRPSESGEARGDSDAEVGFTGRGVTVFTWDESMRMDARTNDVMLTGTVQMRHQPLDGSEAVQFDARQLIVDLEETGGLSVWSEQDAPTPDLRQVSADRGVRIVRGPITVSADHMLYQADARSAEQKAAGAPAREQVLLWADAERTVEVVRDDPERPSAQRFETVVWNLTDNSFEASEMGAGVVPVPAE